MLTTYGAAGLLTFEEACAQVVDHLKRTAPMAFWSVTRVSDGRQTYLSVRDDAYGNVAGDSVAWSQTFCRHMVAGAAPEFAPDAMAVPEYAAAAADLDLAVGSYVGVPILGADGSLFGTICALDPGTDRVDALTLAPGLRLLADLLSRVLEASSLQVQAERRSLDLLAAESSRARSEAMYRLLVAASRDVISRHAVSGEYLFVSPAVEELFGWAPEQLVGLDLSVLVHPDDLADVRTELLSSSGDGEWTYRVQHRDGRWRWVEASSTVLRDEDGRVGEVLLCSRDITVRRAREAASQQESRLEALGRLSAGLAHEINTPIQFVGDNAHFLAEAFGDLMALVALYRQTLDSTTSTPWSERVPAMRRVEEEMEISYLETEVPSALEQTLAGIERVATIVRAMKTLSHPGQVEHLPANLNEALSAAVTVARHQITSVADLELELGELPPVRCNVADLNQVFLNLLVNAADAVEETGRRGVIRVSTAVDGTDVLVVVADTGGGIPEHVRDRVFDPFFTTKEVGRGTGQGLPLARSMVQDGHGGSLGLDTEAGVGTTLTIRLPVGGRPHTEAGPAG